MPIHIPQCHTCNHPKRGAIDERLRMGDTMTEIAKEFNITYDNLVRHKKMNHHFIPLPQPYREEILKRMETSIDILSEAEGNLRQGEALFIQRLEFEKQSGILTSQAIHAYNAWTKALYKFADCFGDHLKKPHVQVSVFMPILLQIMRELPDDVRKQVHDIVQTIDFEHIALEIQEDD